MIKSFFNPFDFIAGWKALAVGLAVMSLTCVVAFFSNTHFDGVLDGHFGVLNVTKFPFQVSIYEQLNAWLSATILFYVGGLLTARSKVRLIDVAGTLAFARVPLIFVALIGFVPVLHHFPSLKEMVAMLICGLPLLFLFIWMIVLMYNAFRVSCNLKGNVAIWGFAVSLIFAEIISKVIISHIYQHFLSK